MVHVDKGFHLKSCNCDLMFLTNGERGKEKNARRVEEILGPLCAFGALPGFGLKPFFSTLSGISTARNEKQLLSSILSKIDLWLLRYSDQTGLQVCGR